MGEVAESSGNGPTSGSHAGDSRDAMRLCSSEIPDVERVTACMVQKRAQLSDGCKAVFHYAPPAATPANYAPSARPSKPLNLTPHKRG